MSKIYLNVPFSEKDEAKQLGAKWDGPARKWYIEEGTDLNLFKKWYIEEEKDTSAE
ncbi:DNA polymerase III subunit epsilon [Candidatus Hepatincola sp. Av]